MSGRILILDDTNEGRQRLKSCLGHDYSLEFALNIRQGLELLKTGQFELVICGIHLERESVFDLLRAMKSSPDL